MYFAKNVASFPFNSWLSFQRLCRLIRGCILALEMASRGNQLCANCIGTRSFPIRIQASAVQWTRASDNNDHSNTSSCLSDDCFVAGATVVIDRLIVIVQVRVDDGRDCVEIKSAAVNSAHNKDVMAP